MAHAPGDALDTPIYGAHYLLTFPILDADGDPVSGATGLDSEISKDLGTFADCTNEATEIATSSGIYYLYVTGAENTAKQVTIQVKTTSSGAKTTILTYNTTRCPVLASGTAQGGAAGTITLAAGTSLVDNDLVGMFVLITNDTPSGAQYQARRIISNVASTQVATVESNWGTNPSSSSTYNLLTPLSANVSSWYGTKPPAIATAGYPDVNTVKISNTAQTARDIGASVLLSSGTGTGQVKLSSGYVAPNWGDVGNPTTSVALTGTTIATTQKVDVETIKTQAVTCAAGVTVSPYVGSTGAAINGTNANTLSSHDPGATLGTSTLTQTQVTGGAYALNSASFAFNSGLDFTTTQKAATLARVTLVDTTTTVTNQLTAAAIATGVWQDTTAGDFTVASSIGKSLYTSGAVPGAAGGLFIAGTNAATTVTTAFTTTFTGNLTGSVGSVVGAVGSVTGNVGGDVTGSVGSVVGAVGSVTGDIGGLAAGAITDVEDAVWDAVLANHLDAGSTGYALNAAGAAGDPWSTALPGAYASGTAGNIVGNRLDAAITSRMATYTQPTGFLAATFPTTVASTTNITGGTITTVSGNVTGSVGSVATGGIAAASFAAGAVNAAALASDAVAEIWSFNGSLATTAFELLTYIYQATVAEASGTVNDAAATTTSFKTTLTSVDDFWNDALLIFTSGALAGQSRPITTYTQTNGVITFDEALTSAPANGVTFVIQAAHIHPVSQIQSGLATAANLATVAGYLDTEIASILADTNELQTDWANGGRLDMILDARSSQTSVDDLPTNAELSTALGTADDAILAAIAALNNLSSAQAQTAAAAALTAYDPPTNTEMEARTLAAASYFDPTTDTVLIDMTRAVPTSNTAGTVGDALNAARAQGFGKWVKSGTTLTLYASDGTTVVRTFTLDDADAPTSRT